MMTAAVASSSTFQILDGTSQPNSKASSPASPTLSFQTQQPLPPRSFHKTRSQNFPSTPTAERPNNGLFDPPNGMGYAEFLRTWSDNHVARWLSDIKCGNHASTFKANDIRGDILLELDQITLKEMGIASIGDRLRMINAVKILRQKCSTRSTISVPFEAVRPRVYVSGEFGDGGSSASSGESGHGRSDSLTEPSTSSRLAHRLQNKPPPLHLNSNNRNDLPRLVRDGSESRSGALIRPLPQITPVNGTTSASSRPNLPPLPPAPRSQPPLPPGRPAPGRLQPGTQQQRARTPTQTDLPPYTSTPLPPAPPYMQNMLTPPTTAGSQGTNWSASGAGYGLPLDPRPGNIGGKVITNRTPTRSPNGAHNRNLSFAGVNSPLATTPTSKARPSTGEKSNSHPYASDTARNQGLHAPTAQQLQASLSPIAESFVSSGGIQSPHTAFSVGRGPFSLTPSNLTAPSLDDLRRKLVRFMLPDEGHSCTINAEDCAGGIEVLEKVLKKFNKLGSRGDSGDIMDLVETEDGGLSLDGWGVYIDWGQGEGQGKPLTEGELLSICHAPPDNPARERGLTLRRNGKGKRSKALAQFFGEAPLLRANSPTSPVVLSTGELDHDGNLLSPRHAMSFADAQTAVNTKRASSISILSGLGVPHPEKALDPPPSPTTSAGRKSPAGSASPSKRPSKLRNFFGQRPPSELITTHLAEYFPFTEKKVLERTARNSMMRTSTIGSLNKRDSTVSWNPAPPLPSRFSSSTAGDRSSMISSPPPPIPDKVSTFTGETTPVTDEPPRMSLSTDDGRSIDLRGDETEPNRKNSTPHLLPPVNISAESFSESMENLTGGRQSSRRLSKAMSIASKRMSFMTELRSKRDVSDTASLMTVDQITASVESRRESLAVDTSGDSTDDWTKVGSDQGSLIDESPELSESSDEDGSEEDEDRDEDETTKVDDDDEPGKAITSKGGTKWIKGALIGAGSFGKVYLGMDASNGLLMAVKQVELPTGSAPNEERKKSMLSALEREIDLLKDLQHENIVQYLYSSLDDDYLNIFLEYVPGGSVTALLRNYGAFEEPLVKNFVRQILQGLNYLHERDIIHRDIKGANILVDNKGGIKISDFGISKKVEDNLLGKRVNRPSLQGSVFWMAPEVVKQTSHTHKADIWSVGCLVVEMLTGEHPWAQLTQMQAIFKIGSSAKPTIPSDISADAQDFLQKTFDLDYEARPDAGELLQHIWIAAKKPQAANKGTTTLKAPTIEISPS